MLLMCYAMYHDCSNHSRLYFCSNTSMKAPSQTEISTDIGILEWDTSNGYYIFEQNLKAMRPIEEQDKENEILAASQVDPELMHLIFIPTNQVISAITFVANHALRKLESDSVTGKISLHFVHRLLGWNELISCYARRKYNNE
ncbi:hypothetical protein LCGC14_2133240 [marine sediment metagenome]|uniref:Uncharacterized protein n=1 Tax=marine sediment metagenome TaxID=412755 RepID=A0A0F9E0T5_9ZZZZ